MPPVSPSASALNRGLSVRLGRRLLAVAGALALGALAVTALALAASTSFTVRSARNASLGKNIVVSAKGQTLYALHPESTHHLLCTSSSCLQFWPPQTVATTSKLRAGRGVKGRLGTLRRANGSLQLTLGGLPLYRFSADRGIRGSAKGEGVKAFGGTWHVITLGASPTASPSPAPQSSPSPVPGY